jgi:4-hydroxyproline epimerase
METLTYIDSHTGGEPTRVVISGGPDLGCGSMEERRQCLGQQHDWLRRAIILEPRGSAWLVGALLQRPVDESCVAGVIFFNNAGYLGMCGHGLIGVVETLAHQNLLHPGTHAIETPVGVVTAELHPDRSVSVTNVASYCYRQNVTLSVPGEGQVTGDIAYGGNWFFLVGNESVLPENLDQLLERARRIRAALDHQGIRGAAGAIIDHVELFGPPSSPDVADSRNFVLCPGGEYDRSPCGTGTSAKLACLAAEGKLEPGKSWRQESIIGSIFQGSYQPTAGGILPTIQGQAFVTGHTQCMVDSLDPFRHGIAMPGRRAVP